MFNRLEFSPEFTQVSVPSADADVDVATYTDIACGESISLQGFDVHRSRALALLDIPVYETRVQSLHALFTLYLGFKNSEVRQDALKKMFTFLVFCSISKR